MGVFLCVCVNQMFYSSKELLILEGGKKPDKKESLGRVQNTIDACFELIGILLRQSSSVCSFSLLLILNIKTLSLNRISFIFSKDVGRVLV